MIPVHPQEGLENAPSIVPEINRVRQFPPMIFQNTSCHQQKATPYFDTLLGANTIIFKPGKEFAIAIRGFNLSTKAVFFNHLLMVHIGIGIEVEHDAPATHGTIVESLCNNEDGLLHPSALAGLMSLKYSRACVSVPQVVLV